MADTPAPAFTAKDYGAEYQQLKRDIPADAAHILDVLKKEYQDEYIKKIRSSERKNWKEYRAHHPAINIFYELGFLGGGFAALTGTFVTIISAGALAPIGIPLAVGGTLTAGGSLKLARVMPEASHLARNQIEQDVESGELIKRHLTALKRFGKSNLYLSMFDDKAMSKNHSPVIESKSLSRLPFVTLSFNGNAPKKELPAPDQPLKNNPLLPSQKFKK